MKRLGKLKTKCRPAKRTIGHSCTIRQLRREKNRLIELKRTKDKLIKKLRLRIEHSDLELWSRVRLTKHLAQSTSETNGPDNHSSIKTLADINQLANTLFPQTASDDLPIEILEQHEPVWVNDQELCTVEHIIRNKKYTGPDGIRFSVFKRVIDLEPEIIRELARMSYASGHIPDHCKETLRTLIPKKAAGKYRVVHIASPLTAYLELIALNRLEVALETKKLKDQNQY